MEMSLFLRELPLETLDLFPRSFGLFSLLPLLAKQLVTSLVSPVKLVLETLDRPESRLIQSARHQDSGPTIRDRFDRLSRTFAPGGNSRVHGRSYVFRPLPPPEPPRRFLRQLSAGRLFLGPR
jgi:hypothetical protein